MSHNGAPEVALCPRCFCPLDIRRSYKVDFCLPVQPSFPPSVPTHQVPAHQIPANQVSTNQVSANRVSANQVPTNRRPPTDLTARSSSSAPEQDDAPTPPSELSSQSQPQEHEQGHPAHGEKRRSSASSSSSFDSAFTDFSINTEFAAELQAAEIKHFSQQPFRASSPLPPPTSSPSTESSLTLSAMPTSSPSTESSLTLSALDEPPSAIRRWVVFRGRVPGIYSSSAEATDQTDGFPHAFMLAFDDPAAADTAYERFQEDGTIPAHGRGPWVVFIGRRRGVFTSYEDLCASVVGFSNSCYRCCESIEEGARALSAFLMSQVAATSSTSIAQTVPGPVSLEHHPRLGMPTDDSWWCCFAGAEPGVYNGLDRLIEAAPAPGGVRRVNSEVEGWEMWTAYLADGEVSVVPRV